MKNRLLLALLCIGAMLYIAVPRLPMAEDGLSGLFALSWLLFAIVAIGGNIAALLYLPKRKRVIQKVKLAEAKRARLRQYQ